jgi:hypothetical protein
VHLREARVAVRCAQVLELINIATMGHHDGKEATAPTVSIKSQNTSSTNSLQGPPSPDVTTAPLELVFFEPNDPQNPHNWSTVRPLPSSTHLKLTPPSQKTRIFIVATGGRCNPKRLSPRFVLSHLSPEQKNSLSVPEKTANIYPRKEMMS